MSTDEAKFCTECGSKVTEDTVKCPECGKLLNVGKAVEIELTNSYEKVTTELKKHVENKDEYIKESKVYVGKGKDYLMKIRERLGAHKKLSLVVGCLLGFVLICLLGLNIINNSNTPGKLVDKFEVAIINNDYETLVEIIGCEDKRVTINELTLTPLLSYFDKVPSAFTHVITDLRSQALQLEEGTHNFNSYGRFILKQKGSKNKYYIEIKPIFISLKTELDNVKVSIEQSEEMIGLQAYTAKEIGPIFPGYYHIHSYYDNGFIKLEDNIEKSLFEVDESDNVIHMQLFSDVQGVALESDYQDAVIYVNGKSTKATLEEKSTIFPVNADTKIYGVVKRDGKEFKSQEYSVGSEHRIYLEFPELVLYENQQPVTFQSNNNQSNDIEEAASRLIEQYLSSFAEAVNTGDFGLVEPYLYPGSSLYNTQKTNIPNMHKTGIREEFINYTILNGSYNPEDQEGYITVEEVYEVTKQKPSVSTQEMDFENTYTFKFNKDTQTIQLTELELNG